MSNKNNLRYLYKTFIFLIIFCFAFSTVSTEAFAKKEEAGEKQQTPLMVDMNSQKLEYFPENREFVATGNAELVIKDEGSKLQAKKITFQQDTQMIIAEGDVKIIKAGNIVYGDYTRIDLTKGSALVDNPYSVINNMKIKAEEANIYADEVDALRGKAVINNEDVSFIFSTKKEFSEGNFKKHEKTGGNRPVEEWENEKPSYSIKAKTIELKGKPDHNIIVMKNATIKIGKITIAKMPYFEMSTNKENQNIETMLPEIGHSQELGGYAGPAHVFYTPGGATLKVAPLFTWDQNDIGYGIFSRFMNSTNKTEVGYSTVKEKLTYNGTQELPKDFSLLYGANSYIDNGFFGAQKSDFLVDLVHNHVIDNEDLNQRIHIRSSAGYAEDYLSDRGTMRFKNQGSFTNLEPLWKYKEFLEFKFQEQYDITVYGKGVTTAVVRAGPRLDFNFDKFHVSTSYYQGGVHGESPLSFDKYNYGKSSMILFSSLDVTKKVRLGYLGYINFSEDGWDNRLFAENQIFALVGPEDVKLLIGYDSVRKRTVLGLELLVGRGKTDVDFETLKIINPDDLNFSKKKKNNQKQGQYI
ncbi:MAG: hypothetical protein PHV68_03065 [Candidatus Gastranaerophilales bacterium]|nr:hypothetical protein [Candidatus Gastranaerophilales bacterium]